MAQHPPLYPVGHIFEAIDLNSTKLLLDSTESFNRQAFTKAQVIELLPRLDEDNFEGWDYLVKDDPKSSRWPEILSALDIEYQTGQHPEREYKWCCPYTIVHPGQQCPKCNKKFEDISIERRSK